MYDIGTSLDNQILEVMKNKPTVIFTEATDPRIIEAACYLPRFIRPVFLAGEDVVKDIVQKELNHVDSTRVEFTLSESAFVDLHKNQDLVEELARAYCDLPQGIRRTTSFDEAMQMICQPQRFGIMAVRQGHADMVVGGIASEPRDYFRPMARLLAKQEILCEAGVIILPDSHPDGIFPHNILVVGDVGANGTTTPEVLANVAVGTCAVARDLFPEDVLPVINAAMVSYSNKGSDEGPGPERVRKASELMPAILADRVKQGRRYQNINIDSEVKISVALSRRSAQMYRRGQENQFIGGTNVLITPNLDTGNLLFHLYATRYPEAKKFSVMFGLRFQWPNLCIRNTLAFTAKFASSAVLSMVKSTPWKRRPNMTLNFFASG